MTQRAARVHRLRLCLPILLAVTLLPAALAACGGSAATPGAGPRSSPLERVDLTALPIRRASVGDVTLAYRVLGRGRPLVMIMGLGGTMDVWDPRLLAYLAREYTVVIFDNRGMGDSTAPPGPFTIEQMAADTAGLMQRLGYGHYAVLGFSMGTLVAQELALRHQREVQALVLCAATPGGRQAILPPGMGGRQEGGRPGPANLAAQLAAMLSLEESLFPEDWRRQHPDYRSLVPMPKGIVAVRGFGRQIGAMAAWRGSWQRLPRLHVPTLLVAGVEDELTPARNAQRMVGRIPAASLVQFRDAGHGLMYQYPAALARTVAWFLEQLGYDGGR